jgi:hypothetical protein
MYLYILYLYPKNYHKTPTHRVLALDLRSRFCGIFVIFVVSVVAYDFTSDLQGGENAVADSWVRCDFATLKWR